MKTKMQTGKIFLALLLIFALAFAAFVVVSTNTNAAFAEEALAITGANVAIGDSIVVNFHTTAAGNDGSKLVVGFNGNSYELTTHKNGVFSFRDVAPQQMGDNITATLYNAEGKEQASLSNAFSVKSYLMTLLGKTYEESGCASQAQYAAMKELCVDLLNYGAAAQTYKSYNTANLVNAALSDEQKALATGALSAVNRKEIDGSVWKGATVRFDSTFGLAFAFKTADDNSGNAAELDGYTATIDGNSVTPVWDGTYWVIRKNNLKVTEMNTAYTAKVAKDGEEQTYTYSLSSYVCAKGESQTAGLANLVNNAYKFGYAAVAYKYVAQTAPTCSEKGSIALTDAKGYDYTNTQYSKELPTIAHTSGEAVRENEVAATCTENGSYEEVVYCTVCGTELSRETKTIDALGHDWGEWTVTKAATCTEKGEETRICKRDSSHTETRETAALGHTLTHYEAKAATCEEAGNSEYWYCTVCEKYFSDSEGTTETTLADVTIAKKGHDYAFDSFEWADDYTAKAKLVCKNDSNHVKYETATVTSDVTTYPTYESTGIRTYTATYGEHSGTKTEVLPVLEAKYVFDSFVWDGYTAKAKLVDENNSELVKYEEATVTHEVTKEATCEEAGIRTYTATYGEHTATKTEEINALGHEYQLTGWTWSKDYSSATATFTCKNDENHVETKAAVIQYIENEKKIYIATVTFEGETYTQTMELPLDDNGFVGEWDWV